MMITLDTSCLNTFVEISVSERVKRFFD